MTQAEIAVIRQNQATIEGVAFVPLPAYVDDRGYLIEILRAVDPHFTKFGQVYIIGNIARGTVRAFHKHESMKEWFFISHGAAKFVLVDDRHGSGTHGHVNVFVCTARNPGLIVVPTGVYHGHMALEDDTQVISVAGDVYNRTHPDEVRIPSDSFGDVWTVKGR